jgi:fructoselysine-6-P-deglycase FrlB-like protein
VAPSFAEIEIASQPACWRRARDLVGEVTQLLPRTGERVAVIGCGTSLFMAQAYAVMRESVGGGETDAFAASEFPAGRRYDRLVAITRSGATTEILTFLARNRDAPTVALTGDSSTPVNGVAKAVVTLEFADEKSIIQTRFATTALMLLRAHLGMDVARAISDAERAIEDTIDDELVRSEQFTFLGKSWTCGLAQEGALKMREAAGVWAEAYPAMEYRHGPISVTGPKRVAWMLGDPPAGLAADVAATGGTFLTSALDPVAELVRIQRLAIQRARAFGLDPDCPPHLTRSVVLDGSPV